MTKEKTTQSEPTGTKPIENTINGAFSFSGSDVYEVGERFLNWCEEMEKTFHIRIKSNRIDYSGDFRTDRSRE